MTNSVVIDSSVVLAILQKEKGFERLIPYLQNGILAANNALEIACVLHRNGLPLSRIQSIFQQLSLKPVPFAGNNIWAVTEIYSRTRHLGLGYSDCICLGLAKELQIPVVTLDRAWEGLNVGVEIILARVEP